MKQEINKTLIELVKAYSPTGKEGKAVSLFSTCMEKLGAEKVGKDVAGNCTAVFPGDGISVLLCGHIDTVPGKLPIKAENGLLYGRGTVDAKSALVSLMYGAKLARTSGFRGTLEVVAAVGEEGSGKGIVEITKSRARSNFAIFGEPGSINGITVGYRGRLLLDIAFKTESYHASAPWMGTNAVEESIAAWICLNSKYSEGRDFSDVSVALTGIHGGTADNMTPSKSVIRLDVRFPPRMDKTKILKELENIISRKSGSAFSGIKVVSQVDPYVTNTKSQLVEAFKTSITKHTGENAKIVFKSGSGDMNILGKAWKIPAITYGPGDTRLSHTNNEVVNLDEVSTGAEIISAALLSLEGKINAGNDGGTSGEM